MAQAVLRVFGLPASPLDAAAEFHADYVPTIREDFRVMADLCLAIVFEPASHEHRGWRLAALQDLAREVAPARVNGIVGTDDAAIDATLAYLEAAPGITGQMLAVDGKFSENR